MDENKFLQNREVREQQKKSREGPNEDTIARETFLGDMEELHSDIDALLGAECQTQTRQEGGEAAEAEPLDDEEKRIALEKCKAAHTKWLSMQDTIKVAAEVCNLPAHELRSANSLLYHLFTKIDQRKNELSSSNKRFKFSSRVKLCKKTKTMIKEQQAADESVAAALQTSGASHTDNSAGDDIITNRHDATVFITSKKALFIRGCTNCTFLVLPTSGSLFMDNCQNSKLYCASHQLRMKNCKNVDVYVCCRSTPIIEACREMRFGPYTAWSGLLKSTLPEGEGAGGAGGEKKFDTHAEWVKEVGNINNYEKHGVTSFNHVDDFDWLRHQHSPHWSVLEEQDYRIEERAFEA